MYTTSWRLVPHVTQKQLWISASVVPSWGYSPILSFWQYGLWCNLWIPWSYGLLCVASIIKWASWSDVVLCEIPCQCTEHSSSPQTLGLLILGAKQEKWMPRIYSLLKMGSPCLWGQRRGPGCWTCFQVAVSLLGVSYGRSRVAVCCWHNGHLLAVVSGLALGGELWFFLVSL